MEVIYYPEIYVPTHQPTRCYNAKYHSLTKPRFVKRWAGLFPENRPTFISIKKNPYLSLIHDLLECNQQELSELAHLGKQHPFLSPTGCLYNVSLTYGTRRGFLIFHYWFAALVTSPCKPLTTLNTVNTMCIHVTLLLCWWNYTINLMIHAMTPM